jgi:hypothetical protein
LEALNIAPIPDESSCKRHFIKLNNSLGTIHRRWIQSGNGDEQLVDANNNNREVQGGDKLDFLHSENICAMYLWYSLLKAGIFDHAKSDLPDELKADGQAPDISGMATGSASRRTQRSITFADSVVPLNDELGQIKEMMERESQWQRMESKRQDKESQEKKHRSNLYAMMHLLLNKKKGFTIGNRKNRRQYFEKQGKSVYY